MSRSTGKLAAWLLPVLLLCLGSVEALRILGMFPLHGRSHFVMSERLMRGLAARGHQVDVYSHFPLRVKLANYTDYSLAGTLPGLANNVSYEHIVRNGVSDGVSIPRMLNVMGRPICELLDLPIFRKLLDDPPTDPPYDLVVVETFMSNCHLAWGRHLRVPMVAVVTTALFDWQNEPLGNPMNPAVDLSIFSRAVAPMSFTERLGNFLTYSYVKHSFNYNARQQDELVRRVFGPDTPNVVELQRDVSLALINYHPALNGVRALAPAVVPVAGLHIVESDEELSEEVEKFLDESKSGFIYFSFGSMVRIETFPKPVIQTFYETLKKIAPVRALMKIAKPEELPPGLPSNVITHHWLPQVKVLKHKNIRAFITHGGLMGTQESIYHGVPMIGFPLFGDQHFNIESYARRKLAIKMDLKSVTEAAFTEAALEILNNPVYKQSAEKAGRAFRDTPLKPMDAAAFWIEYVHRHGKDALRLPIVDMPWWQASLLDVYAFLAAAALAALLALKFLVASAMRLLGVKRKTKGD